MIHLTFHTILTTNSSLAYYPDPHLLILHNGRTLNINLGLEISYFLQKINNTNLKNLKNNKKLKTVLTS